MYVLLLACQAGAMGHIYFFVKEDEVRLFLGLILQAVMK